MTICFAFYGTENISSISALEMGLRYFEGLNGRFGEVGTVKKIKDGRRIIVHSLDDLKSEVQCNELNNFYLMDTRKNDPWLTQFCYYGDSFSPSSMIHSETNSLGINIKDWKALIRKIIGRNSFAYGILYEIDTIGNGYAYNRCFGVNGIYEDETLAFNRDMYSRGGEERYRTSVLRMVYPFNILNNEHLKIKVDGVEFRAWIEKSPMHGTLELLDNGMWLWEVNQDDIAYLNQYLGELGILIAWGKRAPKRKRRLPG